MKKISINSEQHYFSKAGFLKTLQILSVDIVLGALCSGIMVTKILNVIPGLAWWIVLAISVWLIYAVDHLSDGLKTGYNTNTIRYLFHYHYKKRFIVFILFFGILAAVIAFFWLDYRIVYFGITLGVLVLFYLIINGLTNKLKFAVFPKEIIIAVLYTVGIWGGPLALINYSINFTTIVILVLFSLIALSNLFIFSLFEKDKDFLNKQTSIATLIGEKKLIKLIKILGFIVILSGILLIILTSFNITIFVASIILVAMQLSLLVIIYRKDFFKINERYRLVGDAVFFLPLIMIIL